MRRRGRRLAVTFHRVLLLAELFVRVTQQALDKRIVLIRLPQLLQRGLVVAPVKRDVPRQVGKE